MREKLTGKIPRDAFYFHGNYVNKPNKSKWKMYGNLLRMTIYVPELTAF